MDDKEVLKARNYTWRLLALRMRSEKEIRDRLKLKKFCPGVIEETAAYFKGLGLINDREFALAWINSRLAKPLGFRIIESELAGKGVSNEIIRELIDEKKLITDESKIIRDLAGRRLSKLRESKEPLDKIKPRLYAYLTRRGFSIDTVSEVVNDII